MMNKANKGAQTKGSESEKNILMQWLLRQSRKKNIIAKFNRHVKRFLKKKKKCGNNIKGESEEKWQRRTVCNEETENLCAVVSKL